jgi:hypothetical membrane protein
MKYSSQNIAGLVLLAGLAQFVLFLQIAQDMYPNYSTSQNYISDLGATCRHSSGSCIIVQPSSFIFNSSILMLGVLLVIDAYYLYKAYMIKLFSLFVCLAGVGAMGTGLFPENTGVLHIVFSFITFLFVGPAAVMLYRMKNAPLSYISVALGLLILVDMTLFATGNYFGLGIGGMERMIVYPAIVWGLIFAGFLINRSSNTYTR